MGEAKRKMALIGATNGGSMRPPRVVEKRVPIVPNIKLQNVEGHTLLMLGDSEPKMGVALAPREARQLAQALERHAEQVEGGERRIILPGEAG